MEVDVRAGLQKLAEGLGGEGAALTEAQRLSGGASMETWAFGFEGTGGPERLILRRRSAPLEAETARSISLATEAALIQATGASRARLAAQAARRGLAPRPPPRDQRRERHGRGARRSRQPRGPRPEARAPGPAPRPTPHPPPAPGRHPSSHRKRRPTAPPPRARPT